MKITYDELFHLPEMLAQREKTIKKLTKRRLFGLRKPRFASRKAAKRYFKETFLEAMRHDGEMRISLHDANSIGIVKLLIIWILHYEDYELTSKN